MIQTLKRVVEIIRVSSKCKTKVYSAVFVLSLAAVSICSLGLARFSIASDITAENVISLTNISRTESGQGPLAFNAKLSQAAEAKAEDMISNNYFSHTSPAGITPWNWFAKENYDYNYAGENLAMDFHSAEKMEEAWMASPTHRANIVNDKYKEIGVAVKEGNISGHDTMLAVVMFGSGDRNLSSASDVKKDISVPKEDIKTASATPLLPVAQNRKVAVTVQEAIVMSPQFDEILSADDVDIIGRANPGDTIDIFDNENFVATAVADSNGRFSVSAKNMPEGKHIVTVRGKKFPQESTTEFSIDRGKPEADFRLYADENNPSQFFLTARADKKDCIFQFDGEKRMIAEGNEATFSISASKSSAILRIADLAGNKNFKQINIANYYAPEKQNSITENVAALLSTPENILANDSGQEAVKNNLGIAPHQFLASQITVGD